MQLGHDRNSPYRFQQILPSGFRGDAITKMFTERRMDGWMDRQMPNSPSHENSSTGKVFKPMLHLEINSVQEIKPRKCFTQVNQADEINPQEIQASSEKVPSNMRKMSRFKSSCAKHLGLCSPFIHSLVSNDSFSGQ